MFKKMIQEIGSYENLMTFENKNKKYPLKCNFFIALLKNIKYIMSQIWGRSSVG